MDSKTPKISGRMIVVAMKYIACVCSSMKFIDEVTDGVPNLRVVINTEAMRASGFRADSFALVTLCTPHLDDMQHAGSVWSLAIDWPNKRDLTTKVIALCEKLFATEPDTTVDQALAGIMVALAKDGQYIHMEAFRPFFHAIATGELKEENLVIGTRWQYVRG